MDSCLIATTKTAKFACQRPPLFKMIEVDHVICDSLHLFLRITDRLLLLLVSECRRQDGLNTIKQIKENNVHMMKLQKLLKDNNIFFSWKTDDNGHIIYPELRGPEKVKLYSILNVPKLLPKFKYASKVQVIWDQFHQITELLRNETFSKTEIKNLENKIRTWFGNFLEVYQTRSVTPYIHILVHHVVNMIKMHGSLTHYCQQERMN